MASTKGNKKKHVKKQRKVIITDWLTDDADWEAGLARWQSLNESQIRYAVYVVEQGGESGKTHIQGFIHFQRPVAYSTIKTRLKSKTIHIEWVENDEKAVHYCSKPHEGCSCKHCKKGEGKRLYGPVEIGEMPNYASKATESPTDMLTKMIEQGLTDEQIAENAPWALLRHSRGINALRFALQKKQSKEWREVQVILLTGDAGTGKTAWAIADSQDGYFKPDLSKKEIWFDGYQGERTLILDDFRGSSAKLEQLLKLLDGHQLSIPIKGGHTYALWTRVIITSNRTPEDWYSILNPQTDSEWFDVEDTQNERNAFWRRITAHVEDIDEKAQYPRCIELVAQRVANALQCSQAEADGGRSSPQGIGEWTENATGDLLDGLW